MSEASPPAKIDDPSLVDNVEEVDHPALQALTREVSLGAGAAQGGAWLGGSRIALQAFQFAVSVVTARLLTPADFGVAALALAVAAFANIFTDLGLAAAVVHARRASADLLNTAFFLNLGSGVGLSVVTAALAWPLSLAYGQPDLMVLTMVAGLNFAFAWRAVPTALLERTFNYKRLAIIETATIGLGVLAVPIAAVLGLGSLSLVIGPLLGTVLLNFGLWAAVPWRPDGRPSRQALADLWRYSKGLVAFNVLTYWTRNVDTIVLGAAVSPGRLGEYNRAFNLMMVPVQQMSNVLGRVLFPALARLQDDRARLGQAWLRGLSVAAAGALPITVTFATTAPALIVVLYGDQWIEMTPILELLALSAVPQIVAASCGSVYRAMGETGKLFRIGCITASLTVLAVCVPTFAGLGTRGVAAGLLINSVVCLPLAVAPAARALGIGLSSFARLFVVLGGPVLGMAVAQLAIRWAAPAAWAPFAVLTAQLTIGMAVYIALLRATDAPIVGIVSEMVRRRLASRKRKA